MDQLVNHASKWSYMFGGEVNVPLVVWACIGRGWGSAAQHSQALQGLFMHVPGLKLVMPSTCYDAKGLLLSADPDPMLILVPVQFYIGLVPYLYQVPIGKRGGLGRLLWRRFTWSDIEAADRPGDHASDHLPRYVPR
jgi:pyruvate dehydrogenase E1 component beta subunit